MGSPDLGKDSLFLSQRIHVKPFSGFPVIRGELGDVLTGLVEPEHPPWVLSSSISLQPHRLARKWCGRAHPRGQGLPS